MHSTPTCHPCDAAMERGFVPEITPNNIACTVWHPGAPTTVKQNWRERLASPGGVRYGRDEVLAIDAYRCPKCGRVELFALRPPGED